MFLVCLGFVGGVLVQSILHIPDALLLAGFAVAALCIACAVWQKKFLVYACVLIAAVAGMARYGDAEGMWWQQRGIFLTLAAKKDAMLYATVVSRENLANAKRYTLERVTPENIIYAYSPIPRVRLQLIDTNAQIYSPGDRIVIRGAKLDMSDEFVSLLKRDGVAGTVAFPKELALEGNACSTQRWSTSCFPHTVTAALIYTREAFERSLRKTLSEPQSALAEGLLLGARTGLPTDVKESFRYLGLSHIVAVSGYNITIVVLAVSTLLGFLMVPRRASFWFATTFLVLFALLTGGSASVVRAAVMGFLVILAQHASRMYSARIAIALAGALMLFQNPFLLRHDVGFMLSFLATVGLLVLYPLLEEYCKHLPKFGPAKEVVLQSLSAQAFVLPVLIFAFGSCYCSKSGIIHNFTYCFV